MKLYDGRPESEEGRLQREIRTYTFKNLRFFLSPIKFLETNAEYNYVIRYVQEENNRFLSDLKRIILQLK